MASLHHSPGPGRAIFLAVLAAALVGAPACGGGGGSSPPTPVTFTVSTSAGAGGSISPATASVRQGQTASFTVSAHGGYRIAAVTGCGGTLSNVTFTTAPVNANCTVSASFAAVAPDPVPTAWMKPGVRAWYLGAVDGAGPTSSNATEAYLIDRIDGTSAHIVHHSALNHWQSPLPIQSGSHPLLDKGPFWMHPAVLANLRMGDFWKGQEITLVTRSDYTMATFPYSLLPAHALFQLQSRRELVRISYMMPGFSVGNAYFDAETGLLLYYHALSGIQKMFFILGEINFDFAQGRAFPEDDGPHTGFKSFASEQSLWGPTGPGGGGSVVVQSLVESRYGPNVSMLVQSSFGGPAGTSPLLIEKYAFFGEVPVLRHIQFEHAANLPPEQWTPYGEHLWWWLPPAALQRTSINVLGVPMTRDSTNPPRFVATQSPDRFHYTMLEFDNHGYLAVFSAKDPRYGLDLTPADYLFQNATDVHGISYYRDVMGRAVPTGSD